MLPTYFILANPWQSAYTIWGRSMALTAIIYTVLYAPFFGFKSILAGAGVGLMASIISVPAILVLRLVLPWLLRLTVRSWRIFGVTSLVVLLFLLFAIPVCIPLSKEIEYADSAQFSWSMLGLALLFASPCLIGALAATAYTCRPLLFRDDALAGPETF